VAAGPTSLRTVYVGDGTVAQLDAVLVQPEVEWLVVTGAGHTRALLRSFALQPRSATISVPGSGPVLVSAYDGSGQVTARTWTTGDSVTVSVEPGGFTIVQR